MAGAGAHGSDQQSPSAGEEAGGEDGTDAELDRALGDLDGDILDKRIAAQDRAKDPREQTGGRNATEANADDGGKPNRRTIASTVPNTPPVPRPETPDTPDARDEDVVARQLCEAFKNEKDPKLRAALWEEYKSYVSGLPGRKAKKMSNCAPTKGRPVVNSKR